MTVQIAKHGSRISAGSSNHTTKTLNQQKALHLKNFFLQGHSKYPELNGPRIDNRKCLTVPCFDPATSSFEEHDPLNSCPPLGVTAAAEYEDYSPLSEKELVAKLT